MSPTYGRDTGKLPPSITGERINMTDTVAEEQETAEEVVDEVLEHANAEENLEQETQQEKEEKKEEFVPVSAQIAERRKRQEAEERARWLEQQMSQMQQQKEPEPDNSDDLLTVGQQAQALNEWKRSILEESYMENNPDIVERIKTELPEVLENPGNKWLADSIAQAPNRLQRAAQVLEMFKPKKPVAAPPIDRTNTPKSPQSMAKTNKLSIADRIMTMSDQELDEWRVSQKRKIR